MNYDRPVVATTASIEGEVFVKRDGVELPLKEDTVLQAGDVIRTTGNSMALVSIPGTQKQTPAFLEISNGGVATLEFDPAAGVAGQVNVASNNGEGAGLVALVTDRNPLPFPDRDYHVFSASSPAALVALEQLMQNHGHRPRFRIDSQEVDRTVFSNGTIINYPHPRMFAALGEPALCKRSIRGRPKAAVLPLPVLAWAIRSCPAKVSGKLAAWMGVIWV